MRVLDIGAGHNPDSRSTETVDVNAPADHDFDLDEDWPIETASVDGIVANHVVEHLDASHVFAEAGRILRDDGWFELTVPLGENARTDPDHVQEWTFGTPARYCCDRQESWDDDTVFQMVDRSVEARLGGPLELYTPLFQLCTRWWPGWVADRCYQGELTARYRRCPR